MHKNDALKVISALFIGSLLLSGCTPALTPTTGTPSTNTSTEESTPVDSPNSVFLHAIPRTDPLGIKAIPSVSGWQRDVDNDSEGIVETDSFYLVSDDKILELDFAGNLLAYSNPNIISCAQDVVEVGRSFFIACSGKGVYEVDRDTNQLIRTYDSLSGLHNLQNLDLATDGVNVWVGTFNGLGRIDTQTEGVEWYTEMVSKVSFEASVNVYSRNGETWVLPVANGGNEGRLALYDKENDSWKQFNKEDLGGSDFENLMLSRAILTDDGAYIVSASTHNLNDPVPLAFYSYDSQTWEKLGIFPETEYVSHLPARETYTNMYFSWQEPHDQIHVYDGSTWRIVTIGNYDTLALCPALGEDTYLFSSRGVEILAPDEKFPRLIASAEFGFDNTKCFSSEEQGLLVMVGEAYGMGPSTQGLAVYDINSKKLYSENLDEATVSLESLEAITFGEGKVIIPTGDGLKNFTLDLSTGKLSLVQK